MWNDLMSSQFGGSSHCASLCEDLLLFRFCVSLNRVRSFGISFKEISFFYNNYLMFYSSNNWGNMRKMNWKMIVIVADWMSFPPRVPPWRFLLFMDINIGFVWTAVTSCERTVAVLLQCEWIFSSLLPHTQWKPYQWVVIIPPTVYTSPCVYDMHYPAGL